MNTTPDSNVQAVIEHLIRRSQIGLRKYGVTTDRQDLTLDQWLAHLQEELLDGAVYVERIRQMLRNAPAASDEFHVDIPTNFPLPQPRKAGDAQ